MWCHLKFREITRNKWDESLRFWTLELWTKEKRWLCLTPKHYIHYHIQFKFMLTIVNECKIVFGFVLSTRIYYWFTLIRCKTQTYFGKNRSERFLIEKKKLFSSFHIFLHITSDCHQASNYLRLQSTTKQKGSPKNSNFDKVINNKSYDRIFLHHHTTSRSLHLR